MINTNRVMAGAKYSAPPPHGGDSDSVLRILITTTQFVYLLTEKNSARVIAFQPFHFYKTDSLDEWAQGIDFVFENNPALSNGNYAEKKIAVFFPAFTLVPAHLDIPGVRKKLMELNVDCDDEDIIFSDEIPSEGNHLLYTAPKHFLKQLPSHFENHLQHSLTGLLDHLISLEESSGSRRLYAYIQSGSFQLIYIKEKTLKFCNSFMYQSPEDFIYHLLFVCHQLHIDPELITVTLMGEIMRDSSLYQLTNKYIRQTEFARMPKGYEFTEDYPLPAHFFFNLFCI